MTEVVNPFERPITLDHALDFHAIAMIGAKKEQIKRGRGTRGFNNATPSRPEPEESEGLQLKNTRLQQ